LLRILIDDHVFVKFWNVLEVESSKLARTNVRTVIIVVKTKALGILPLFCNTERPGTSVTWMEKKPDVVSVMREDRGNGHTC
jgi:hypothetical protein